MGRLDGKAILVIGGAQGIGRGCVLAAASEGAQLVIGDLNDAGARAVAEEATARGTRAVGIHGDVVDRTSVDAMVATALAEFGHLDGLVNLAYAHDGPAPLAELSTESLTRELHVDVVGSLIAMQAVYGELRGRGGSIVNFGSGAGIEGMAGRAAYSSAKAAVRLLSRTAALEWGAEDIRVNCVCPFAMSPSLTEAVRAGTVDQAQLDSVSPLGRPGDPERDIGAGVAFLLSDDARYVTGQTFMLDGGGMSL
jgi:NAD(P)-dependent dehydrogenase (short-subunit alcohol dehydrogenase family)